MTSAAPQTKAPPPFGVTLLMAVAVVLASWLLHIRGLGEIPFHTKGEPREAVAVQDLVGSKRIALPLRNGSEMPRKPPLFHWLGAAVSKFYGRVDERSVRLPSALQSCAAALLVLFVGYAFGNPTAGLLAALVLLSSLEWARSSTSARIDMTLALGTTASFAGLSTFGRTKKPLSLALLYGGMIWGTLAKGPIGIILPTLCIGTWILLDRGTIWLAGGVATTALAFGATQLGAPLLPTLGISATVWLLLLTYAGTQSLRQLGAIPGYAIVGVATAAWYALALAEGGGEFFELQILTENFGRFLGTSPEAVGHEHGPGYLFGAFAAGFLPWILFLPFALVSVRGVSPAIFVHCLIWIGVTFGFFTLSSSKRSVYLLPLYPAASLLVGTWLARVAAQPVRRPALRLVCMALGVFGAVFFGAVAVAFALQIEVVDLLEVIVRPAIGAGAGDQVASAIAAGLAAGGRRIAVMAAAASVAGIALTALAQRQSWRPTVVALFLFVFTVLPLVQNGFLPPIARASDRSAFVERVRSVAGDRPVLTLPIFDYGFAYHAGGAVPIQDLTGVLPDRAIVVVQQQTWRELPEVVRARYEPIPGLAVDKQNNQGALIAVQAVPKQHARAN